ncbi:MAG: nucleotide exchange factor GrpE [Gammaproteobacteria bacterium]|jgi:molecular chaperone GrpE|nr:nucleotide exchange factor GrpE [Gammaproteobacteria bacterium]HJN95270.1 nucleotide exchange factor GrpE [Gammaproteobacteria bacterium]|tara:strand:- start:15581 stop:16207 length:627 start_codon:yes stop_codon:yes gene_type:complete
MSKQTPKDEIEVKTQKQEQAPESEPVDGAENGAESPTQPDTESDGELSLEAALEKLAEAEEAAHQAKDDLLRVKAEMQNLRRRTEQDIEKAHKYGQERFSSELLAVMDNLERSLEAASKHEDEAVKAIYEGVDLTLKSFTDCFSKFQIVAVDPMGEPFDPQQHQAMSIQENPEVEPNTVVAVMQKGYTLHGRVIRPAMVMVSKESASD